MSDLSNLALRQTWQIAALVLMVWGVTRLIGPKRQHMKYLLWLLVFLKCLTPPLICSQFGIFCWIRSNATEQLANTQLVAESSEVMGNAEFAVRFGNEQSSEVIGVDGDGESRDAGHASVGEFAIGANAGTANRLIWLWWCGSLVVSTIAIVRTIYFFGRICERCETEYESVQSLVCDLSQRLGLRRFVRVWVTRAHVGPAVYGLVRPTIVLPETLLSKLSTKELEPILAHELLHIRRGDLWVNLLQAASKSVWWFNPFVWTASRRINIAAESCCDEQTVAALECDPRTYANSLLRVLEMKHCLFSTPSFPGVRPVEITAQRMERIMDLRHGCQKRTPAWCWLVLLVFALLFIPGGSLMMVAAQEDAKKTDASLGEPEESEAQSVTVALETVEATAGVESALAAFDDEADAKWTEKTFIDYWRLAESECLQVAFQNSVVTTVDSRKSSPNAAGELSISRTRKDRSLVDWEESVVEMVNSALRAYWELGFYYEQLAATKVGRDHALSIWQKVRADSCAPEREAQAREQYFFFQDRIEQSQADLLKVERRLRYTMGLPAYDGRVLRPAQKINSEKPQLEGWDQLLARAKKSSPAIRRIRWQLSRREMELQATKKQLKPFWGDSSKVAKELNGDLDRGGFPLGMRRELAQLRSSELGILREKERLEDIQLEIEHQLKKCVEKLNADWRSVNTDQSRGAAAKEQVTAIRQAFDAGTAPLDLLLDAQRRQADATISEAQARTNLKLSRIELHRQTGSLLSEYSIRIKEDDVVSE